MDEVFDVSLYAAPEDVVVRLVDDASGRWVDVIHTPAGRRALRNYGPGWDSADEAIAWTKNAA